MSSPKYVICFQPKKWTQRFGRVSLWIETYDIASADFAFNSLLGTTPEKGVEYTIIMYVYDFFDDVKGVKTTKRVKSINIFDGAEVA